VDTELAADAAQAERFVRRGDLLTALEIYDRLLDQSPDDPQLIARKEAIGSMLQPSELLRARAAKEKPEDEVRPEEEPALTLEMEGERLANAGRFAAAAERYEEALRLNPDNELLRERLTELRSLAPPETVAREAEPVAEPVAAPVAVAESAPEPMRDGELPEDPQDRLQALLQRITQNRRA
jgi:tetratricopeptide (TPR) repeat protein